MEAKKILRGPIDLIQAQRIYIERELCDKGQCGSCEYTCLRPIQKENYQVIEASRQASMFFSDPNALQKEADRMIAANKQVSILFADYEQAAIEQVKPLFE
jgi:hypothetical protein